ncbi:dienelactone hydrolase [Rhodobacteraceae bacterium WD3A24]|nr:dienelactone hydrolase [Rhodobacteraceae bacterium WD3A24]
MKRLSLSVSALALAAVPALAEVESAPFEYTVGETTFAGHVAHDPATESRGTVLIVHDWDGLTDYEVDRAEALAARGYTAFAIDVFGAQADPQGVEDYQRLTGALYSDREEFRRRLMGAIEAAADIPGASDAAMAMIGYCFGGAAVLETARGGADLDAFVSFHGGLGTPDGQDYSATEAPILLLHGSADPVSGPEDLAALMEQLTAAGVPHRAEVYGGARHAFTVPGGNDYIAEFADMAWDEALGFLDANL